jgi:predicted membrane channel-forming protein YqfA (hemolysin III family)
MLAALLAFGLLAPDLAGAQSYGSQINQAGQALYSWIRSIGAVILAIGISGAGFQMAVAHDREAMKKFFYVILGGLIVFLAPSFVSLIQGVAGSAQSLNLSGQ